jgi:hypothetical protein
VTMAKLPDATAQQAATIGAIYYDKQRLALQLPGSYSASNGTLEALADRFKAIEANHRAIQDSVCATQDKDDT